MKISVIIPAYNEEKLIGRCLESIKSQSVTPYEVIVVDNNSVDRTVVIAKNFGARIISAKKQGSVFARNAGFNSAKGNIIARTDADSYVNEDWIKTIESNFKDEKLDALSGPLIFYDFFPKTTLYTRAYTWFLKILLGHETLIGANMVIRKKMWEKVKNNVISDPDRVHEDLDLSINILQKGGITRYDTNLLVYTSSRRLKSRSFWTVYVPKMIKTLKIYIPLKNPNKN